MLHNKENACKPARWYSRPVRQFQKIRADKSLTAKGKVAYFSKELWKTKEHHLRMTIQAFTYEISCLENKNEITIGAKITKHTIYKKHGYSFD